jgi:hypothetical protein
LRLDVRKITKENYKQLLMHQQNIFLFTQSQIWCNLKNLNNLISEMQNQLEINTSKKQKTCQKPKIKYMATFHQYITMKL